MALTNGVVVVYDFRVVNVEIVATAENNQPAASRALSLA
jgi:hypothetical protein